MLVANIKWTPVRLSIERVDNGKFIISRGGKVKGKVQWVGGRQWPRPGWIARRAYDKDGDLRFSDHYGPYPSFRIACLYIARHDGLYMDSDGIQDYGLQRVRRVGVGGKWFTVLTDPNGRYHPVIFEDYPPTMEKPTEFMQAMLRRVLHAIDKHTLKR